MLLADLTHLRHGDGRVVAATLRDCLTECDSHGHGKLGGLARCVAGGGVKGQCAAAKGQGRAGWGGGGGFGSCFEVEWARHGIQSAAVGVCTAASGFT